MTRLCHISMLLNGIKVPINKGCLERGSCAHFNELWIIGSYQNYLYVCVTQIGLC